MVGQVSDIFKGSDLGERFSAAMKTLGEKVLPVLERAWNRILATVRDNHEGLEKLGRFIADYLIPFFGSTLVEAIDATTLALQGIIWVSAHVIDVVQVMGQTFLNMLGLVVHSADIAFGWIPELGPKLHEATGKFDAWANGIMDKLHQLDGAARGNALLSGASGWAALRNSEGRATGGPVWAGHAYTANEFGPEGFIAATTGTVQPYQANGASAGTAQVFQLELTLRGEDGRTTHEKLLSFKANTGKLSLDLG
jgi:hypothetical protein